MSHDNSLPYAVQVSSVRRLGAEVVLIGDTFDETSAYAKEQSKIKGMPYIPPFDHPLVIAGQGTIGLEILRQVGVYACHSLLEHHHLHTGGMLSSLSLARA